jgi:hypothetical protein
MADDIVQTIKIEVDGADQAAAEIKKVGQATEEVQATAASTAGGTQAFGKGLDEVSQKSGVSSRELRSLGKIMKEMGAGEIAGTAVGIARIGMTLGALGATVFAVAAAFSFFKGKMKEAEEQLKATTAGMAALGKVAAEMHPELAGGKEASNNVALITDQLESMGKAARTSFSAITALTTSETMGKAFAASMENAGKSITDMSLDAKTLEANLQFASLRAAKMMEGMAPLVKLKFGIGIKDFFPPSMLADIEKGTAALEKSRAAAERQKQAVDELAKANERLNATFKATSFTPPPVEDWSNLASLLNSIANIADSVVAFFARIPPAVDQSIAMVRAAIQALSATIQAWVTTPIGNAWQWLKDSFQSVLDWIAAKWAEFKKSLGFGGGAPVGAGAAGGQVGGSAGFAGGGLLGGRGSGTSDSNLAWVSRGEHIMPARAVSQPGVLALLEALRFSGGNLRAVLAGMGHFALGGLVMPRLSIPALGGGMHNVTIAFPGLPDITGLRASSAVVDELRNAAAMAQVRSGGRKPSRYS